MLQNRLIFFLKTPSFSYVVLS